MGGLATSGLISWYEPLCDGKGNQIIGGMAEELIRLSCKYGFENLPAQWGGSGVNESCNHRYATFYSPTVFTLALDEFVLDSGVKIRFDTYAVCPVMDGSHCRGVLCECADGREYYEAGVVIDATGDASICHRAGIPTVCGKNYMTYIAHVFDQDSFEQYRKDCDLVKFRRWNNTGSDMLGNNHPEGMERVSGVTADEITDYVLAGKKSMLAYIQAQDKDHTDIMTLPTMPQLRTIRRIVGATDFCAVDGMSYEDNIGCCGDFRMNKQGCRYQIPYRCLYHPSFDNILAAGRIISAPQGDGWEVSRVIPVCALTGEAAGNAAALMIEDQCAAAWVDILKLQDRQRNHGVRV